MRRFIPTILLVLSTAFIFTACLGDDTETSYYSDTAISSFKLSYANRHIHTLSSKDVDSVYSSELSSASTYSFYIDQSSRLIYNQDSLPIWTDPAKILCTIGSKNSGTIVLKSLKSDSLGYYSSTDTIDFSQPREFRVYANDGSAYRKYTVKVNIHQEQADSFAWHRMNDNSAIAGLVGMKAVQLGDNILVFGNDGSKTVLYSTAATDGNTWKQISTSVSLAANAYCNVVKKGDKLYTLSNGNILATTDGVQWTTIATATGIKALAASSTSALYALSDANALMKSTDNGVTWSAEKLDADAKYLPTANVNYVTYPQASNDSVDRVMLVGNRDVSVYPSDTTAVVWNKVEEYSKGSDNNTWNYYLKAEDNKYKYLPMLNNLSVVPYDNGMLAFGGEGLGKSSTKAFKQIYKSLDMGITWLNDTIYKYPTNFSSSTSSFAVVNDSSNVIWLICGKSGQIWRGRLNRLGWKEEKTAFVK